MRVLLSAIIALLLTAMPALPQANYRMFVCGQRQDIVDALSNRNGEHRLGFGVMQGSNGAVSIDIYAAPNGRWTILYNYPNGKTCLLAHGTDWTPVKPPAY